MLRQFAICVRPRTYNIQQIRWKFYINKISPRLYPTLQERLDEKDESKLDPELHDPVNIGLPGSRPSRKKQLGQRLEHIRNLRVNPEIEIKAKSRELKLDLDLVQSEWEETSGPHHIRTLAEHYGIFKDLFGKAYFVPRVILNINFNFDEETVSPVYRGNVIKPKEASNEPSVEFSSSPDDLWTLILTNPDGNLKDSSKQCLHWFIGNIPGSDVSKGEVIMDYMQPFPPQGIGYQRLVFLLYKQEQKMDYTKMKKNNPCLSLADRSFSNFEFYRENQDHLTPAGVSWFQADWDTSLTDFFHNTLNMKEPVYEYDFPGPYMAPQKWYPKKRAFNKYMDMHKNKKVISQELLLKRLKNINPLEPEKPPVPFPAALPIDKKLPSWLKREIKKERLGLGKYKELYKDNRPQFDPNNKPIRSLSDIKNDPR